MKEQFKKTALGRLLVHWKKKWVVKNTFENSEKYWIERYTKGGNSGAGSYDRLAVFKADVINAFVKENNVCTVLEFGCGDGNQLRYFNFPSYTGYDISPQALERCRNLFANDTTKQFALTKNYDHQKADLSMSLDVIYHLVEEETYTAYMTLLFQATQRYVLVYSSNEEEKVVRRSHVRQRRFTDWVEANRPDFKLIRYIPNQYPYNGDSSNTSIADFYLFEKRG